MPVTDHQAATLRALLAADFDEHARLRTRLDREADRDGYSSLIAAAFFEAADQRFAAGHDREAITGFVASARATTASAAEQIDPGVAERMIRAVFDEEDMHDVPGQVQLETQVMLLAALVADARFGPAGLDEFMAESRKVADRWMS